MAKIKAIEYENREALTYVGDIDDVANYSLDNIQDSSEIKDVIEMEKLIDFLSADEVSVLVLRHLGYKSNEIYKIVGLNNMSAYRKLSRNLKMRIYLFKNFHQLINN